MVFLGTGARSYMNPEELGELGIDVHLIKGYGDTAVAECAIALMWEAARGIARMDREMRAGNWLREDAMQLTGKTLGLIGFGGIAAEVARIASGSGMRVIAWNRSPKKHPKIEFVDLDELLTESDVVSIHLLLNDETRGLVSRACIEAMKPGMIWSGAMMLEHLGEKTAAASIVGAIERTLGERTLRTRDLGGNADTTACGKAVADMVE